MIQKGGGRGKLPGKRTTAKEMTSFEGNWIKDVGASREKPSTSRRRYRARKIMGGRTRNDTTYSEEEAVLR